MNLLSGNIPICFANDPQYQQYIVKLIGKIIAFSLERVGIVESLPERIR